MSISLNGAAAAGGPGFVDGMDLETALLSVQNKRSQLLENQLRAQLGFVQDKNGQIESLNKTMNSGQAQLDQIEATMPANETKIQELKVMKEQLEKVRARDPNGWTGLSWNWAGDNAAASHKMLERVRAAGLTDVGPAPKDVDRNGTMDAHGSTVAGWLSQIDSKISSLSEQNQSLKQQQGALKENISNAKAQIDSLANSQQMDMLRLQSLSNKRNESFETMTNFIKKMQDNRNSVLGNMR